MPRTARQGEGAGEAKRLVYEALGRAQALEDAGLTADTRLFATSKGQRFDDLYDRGLLIIGAPAYCWERIAALQEWGMTRMLTLSNFGGLAHHKVSQAMQLFADDVIPAFAGPGVSVASSDFPQYVQPRR